MAAIITEKTRIFNAEQIVKSFGGTTPTVNYLFIGRPQVWNDELLPETPIDSVEADFDVRRDMIAMKRLLPSNVSLGIIRRNWAYGVYYDYYRQDYNGVTHGIDPATGGVTTPASLYDANFYVVTDEFNIYKCIWNNYGSPSTSKPTGTSISEFTTADGYRWKYMYTISPSDVLSFVSTDFIPVRILKTDPGSGDFYYTQYQVQQNALNGAITVISVANAGSGYTPSSITIPIVITGDGTGASATGTTNSAGQLVSITVTSVGSGYTYANVAIGGGGTGAVATAIIPPKYGHGTNAAYELGANYVLLSAQLQYDDGDGIFPTTNDYRRIGIIKDPFDYGTTTISVDTYMSATKSMTVDSVTGLIGPDSIMTGVTSGATAIVVSYDSNLGEVRYIQTKAQHGTFVSAETVNFTTGGSCVVDTLSPPDVDIFSGDLIYLENRRSVTRDPLQIEDIKITIET